MGGILALLKLSFSRDLIYRTNLWSALISRLGFLIVSILWFSIMYSSLLHVKSWGYAESMFFLATFQLVETITVALFGNSFANWHQQIISGSLDVMLTKPIDTQLALSLHAISFPQLVTIGAPLALIIQIASTQPLFSSALIVLAYIVGIALAVIIFYNIWLLIMTVLFRLIGMDQWHQLFRGITSFMQVPPIVYDGAIKFLFYFVLPVFAAVMLPLDIVWHHSWQALAILLAIALLTSIVARIAFRLGLKAYNSASS